MVQDRPRLNELVGETVLVDRCSFEDFYRHEYKSVLALARVLTGDRTRAEDVTHDAFAAALKRWGELDNPTGWVRRVAINRARSAWRRTHSERKAMARLESEVRPDNDLPEDTEEFWRVVRSLPVRQAQAIALFYLEDLPVSEIAEAIGCAESTARVHLMRGRRNLSKVLGAPTGGGKEGS